MKRYQKKVCGFVFTMALCFLYIIPAAAATPTLNAELKPSSDGKTVTVVFSIENNPGIAAYRFTMNYDNTILKPVSTAIGTKITGGLYTDNLKEATTALNVVWANNKNFTGNGELCSATFSVIGTVKDGKYPITITYNPADLCNQAYKAIPFEVKGMTATVQTVSIQSEPSKPASSASTSSHAYSSSPAPISSAVSSMPSSPMNSIAASSYRIEINSQIKTPDYTTSDATSAQSGETQYNNKENSQTSSPGAAGVTSYMQSSGNQSPQSNIPVISSVDESPDLLTIVVLVIAAAAAVALAVLLIKKRKQT